MEPKKELIVHVITTLELNGAQKVCLALFQKTQEMDFDTFLITGSSGIYKNGLKQHKNICLLDSFNNGISIFTLFQELKAFKDLVIMLRKLKKEYKNALIVHTHSKKSSVIARWAAFFAGVKRRVHTIHGYSFHNYQNKAKWLMLYIIELTTSLITTHYICVSSENAKTGVRLLPGFSRKHSIIHAGIDYNNFVKFRPAIKIFPDNTIFIFGTVSGLRPGKNTLDLLKAFAAGYYKNSNTRLEIIGDGPEHALITEWIDQHDLNHVITLHGIQEEVAPIMSRWHAFVLTSLWEGGIPCVIVEARLLKLPIISYKTGGVHDVIINGKNGLLYAQKDWQGLSEGMLQLSMDKDLYFNLQNYTEDLKDFTYQSMIKRHIDLYRKLI